jgi:hypothetical protein
LPAAGHNWQSDCTYEHGFFGMLRKILHPARIRFNGAFLTWRAL